MNRAFSSNNRVNGPHQWYKRNSAAYLTALEALKRMMPAGKKHGIYVGSRSDPFSDALGIPLCKNPLQIIPDGLTAKARRGFSVKLPYEDFGLDFAVICYCDGVVDAQQALFKDVYRVLKINGLLIVAFIDIKSPYGKKYLVAAAAQSPKARKSISRAEKIMFELSHAGFKHYEFLQTLLDPPEKIKEIQTPIQGYGQGSFVVVQAVKKFNCSPSWQN